MLTPTLARIIRSFTILIVVIIINAGLLLFFPAIEHLLEQVKRDANTSPQKLRIVAEISAPPKKEEKKRERQPLRTVNSSPGRSGVDRSGSAQRFTPDLGVELGNGVGMAGGELAAEVFEEGKADEPAVVLFQSPVPYPDRARDMQIQGLFRAQYVVGLDGRVESMEILSSPHPSFSDAARRTLSSWRFKPARHKGVPVRQRRTLEINFSLN